MNYDGKENKRILTEKEMNTLDAPVSAFEENMEQKKQEKECAKFVEDATKALEESIDDLICAGFSEETIFNMYNAFLKKAKEKWKK